MSPDDQTAKARVLIAQARGYPGTQPLLSTIAAHLEAVETESLSVQQSFQVMANQCARAEAENRRLREALSDIEKRATTGQHAAMLARAALAGSGE